LKGQRFEKTVTKEKIGTDCIERTETREDSGKREKRKQTALRGQRLDRIVNKEKIGTDCIRRTETREDSE
jgi:hypothetical protein